jgi:RNA polymerase sigma factor (sigma-70 family)
MTGEPVGVGTIRRDVLQLFGGGAVAALGDGALLDRFNQDRDGPAFAALVDRHGRMVLGTCRRILDDPRDAEDAFQATFLVLARRARTLRDGDRLAPWLHGVATKVARRARSQRSRRQSRETPQNANLPIEPVETRDPAAHLVAREQREAIDAEIARLPVRYRDPVVLRDLEGLSLEEAADRLGWSLNQVRGRLNRARKRLREALARRGLDPAATLAALGEVPRVPAALGAGVTRAALAFSVGELTAAGVVPASVVALSRGVLNMMLLTQLKSAVVLGLTAGVLVTGAGVVGTQAPADPIAQDPKPVDVAAAVVPVVEGSKSATELAKERVTSAKLRFEAQKTFYEEGRITIDRLIDASKKMMEAERDAATTRLGRIAPLRNHRNLLEEITNREVEELKVGRATQADVFEAKQALLEAEYVLAKELEAITNQPERKTGDVPAKKSDPLQALAQQRLELARRVMQNVQKLVEAGEAAPAQLFEASKELLAAQLDAATTRAERVAAIQAHLESAQKFLQMREAMEQRGQTSRSETDAARAYVIELKIRAVREANPAQDETLVLDRRVGELERKLVQALQPREEEAVRKAAAQNQPGAVELQKLAMERVLVARTAMNNVEILVQNARAEPDRFIEASRDLLNAEFDAATTREQRLKVIADQVEAARMFQANVEARHAAGRTTEADVHTARAYLLDLRMKAIREANPAPDEANTLDHRLVEFERKLGQAEQALETERQRNKRLEDRLDALEKAGSPQR